MNIPLPPAPSPKTAKVQSQQPQQLPQVPSLGDVEDTYDRTGTLTDNESKFILDTTLKKKHRDDESVLRFIDHFIRCKHIGEASEAAGIKPSLGYQYRHRMDIANAIQKLTDKSAIKHGFDSSEVIQRVKELMDFDPIDMMNPDGSFKSNMYEIDPAARRSLKKLKVKNLYNQVEDKNGMKSQIVIGEIIEYEFYDKIKASEMLGKEKELFKSTTRVEHAVTKDMESILLASMKRGQEASLTYIDKGVIDAEVVNE